MTVTCFGNDPGGDTVSTLAKGIAAGIEILPHFDNRAEDRPSRRASIILISQSRSEIERSVNHLFARWQFFDRGPKISSSMYRVEWHYRSKSKLLHYISRLRLKLRFDYEN